MFNEKRSNPRVKTHIVIEISVEGQAGQRYGYIENLSEGGMGVVSLDDLAPGAKISTAFFLPDSRDKIVPQASLVHINSSVDPRYGDSLYYLGFRFENLNENFKTIIRNFIGQELQDTPKLSYSC